MKSDATEMQYLLGKLSESEAERFEERYFADDEVFDDIEIAEDDLIDAYVRGKLSPEDRKQFETNLLSSKRIAERVEFARLFTKSGFAAPVAVEPAKQGWWASLFSYSWVPNSALAGAVAGVLLLIVIGIPGSIVWLKLRNESKRLEVERAAIEQQKENLQRQLQQIAAQQSQTDKITSDLRTATERQNKLQQQLKALEEQLANQRRPATDSVHAFASALLFPSSLTRGSGQDKEVLVPPSAATIKLRLVLDANEYNSYKATLQSQANENRCSQETLRPRRSGKNWIINLQCDAQLVNSGGTYLIRVTSSGTPVAEYRFRVTKK